MSAVFRVRKSLLGKSILQKFDKRNGEFAPLVRRLDRRRRNAAVLVGSNRPDENRNGRPLIGATQMNQIDRTTA